jgi:hypothetical protein
VTRRQQFQLGQLVSITGKSMAKHQFTEGRITDIYRGPLTQEWVYVVNDYGFYADEIDVADVTIDV